MVLFGRARLLPSREPKARQEPRPPEISQSVPLPQRTYTPVHYCGILSQSPDRRAGREHVAWHTSSSYFCTRWWSSLRAWPHTATVPAEAGRGPNSLFDIILCTGEHYSPRASMATWPHVLNVSFWS